GEGRAPALHRRALPGPALPFRGLGHPPPAHRSLAPADAPGSRGRRPPADLARLSGGHASAAPPLGGARARARLSGGAPLVEPGVRTRAQPHRPGGVPAPDETTGRGPSRLRRGPQMPLRGLSAHLPPADRGLPPPLRGAARSRSGGASRPRSHRRSRAPPPRALGRGLAAAPARPPRPSPRRRRRGPRGADPIGPRRRKRFSALADGPGPL